MRRALSIAIAILFSSSFLQAFDQNHELFDQVMKKFNNNGAVNYKELKKDPKILDEYLSTLNSISEQDFNKWSKEDRIAFWNNAYNAYTLKAIITNYPIKSSFLKSRLYPKNSIRQIDGVWDKLKWPLLGKKMTLNEIEHKTLRKYYNEPRIHMALVCAAKSCPPLRGEAYTGGKLNAQFTDQTKQFLANPNTFKLDQANKTVFLSPIFKWFGEDFVKNYGTTQKFQGKSEEQRATLNFVSQHLDDKDKTFVLSGQYDVEYLKYDWSLNEQ